MNAESIAKMIRFHRKKSGLSQIALAKLAGLGKTVIFDAENAKSTIKLCTLLRILDVLNIKMTFQSPLMSLFNEES